MVGKAKVMPDKKFPSGKAGSRPPCRLVDAIVGTLSLARWSAARTFTWNEPLCPAPQVDTAQLPRTCDLQQWSEAAEYGNSGASAGW